MKRWLIDTHVLLWVSHDPTRLSAKALKVIQSEARLVVSPATFLGARDQAVQGTHPAPRAVSTFIELAPRKLGFDILSIELPHLFEIATLPRHHDDPFDRLLVSQTSCEGPPVLSVDTALDGYSVKRLW